MAVDKRGEAPTGLVPIEIEMDDADLTIDGAQVIEHDDGTIEVDFSPEEASDEERLEALANAPHFANLAFYLDDDTLDQIGSALVDEVDADFGAKEEWNQTYADGLRLLGIRVEEDNADPGIKPFEGSSDEVDPALMEAVVRFQAQAYKELIPANGPADVKLVGNELADQVKQAHRVKGYLNYSFMEVMPEFEPDFDQMLFRLALNGSQFRKVWYDTVKRRQSDMMIRSQDFASDPNATDTINSRRLTQKFMLSMGQVQQMVDNQAWVEVDVAPEPSPQIADNVQEAHDDITGVETDQGENTTWVDFYETHAMLYIPDIDATAPELPYIVTMDTAGKVRSITRNWSEGDEARTKREYFVHYKFFPGLDFYGFGYIHILGQLARGSTSLLRQLIDAGVLANLPAGFKSRGFRMDRENEPLTPGEFREVDTADRPISESIFALPYKEPSQTLLALKQDLTQSAQRLASMTDTNVGDGNQEMPVGTTVALLERSNMTQSAIHKRLFCAMKLEMRIMARTIYENPPEAGYPYAVEGKGDQAMLKADFDNRVDVIPVADPDMFSMSQRIALAQTQLQMAMQAPQLHDLREAYVRMYDAIGVKNVDRILPPPPELKPTDPLTENMGALTSKPLKAFIDQDHDSHIAAHTALLQNPQFAESPQMKQALQAHIQEHQSFKLRVQVQQQMGQPLPEDLSQLPPEQAAQIAAQIAQATQQVTGQAQAMAQAMEQQAQGNVPERLAGVQEAEVQRKAVDDQMTHEREMLKIVTSTDQAQQKATADQFLKIHQIDQQADQVQLQEAVKLAIANRQHNLEANRQVTDNLRVIHDLQSDDSEPAKIAAQIQAQSEGE